MPRLVGIKPTRNACMCEDDALAAAGIRHRFVDLERTNKVLREHYRTRHAGGPRFEPIV